MEKWALNTSEHADNVAKCIATEIDHVQTAREMMPPPAPAPPVVMPVADAPSTSLATPRSPLAGSQSVEDLGHRSRTLASQDGLASRPNPLVRTPGAFTGVDTIAGPAIDSVVTADATHRQAAEVMAMFQQNSYEVDRTVPSFSPPTNPVAPPPPPPVVVTPNPPVTDGGGGGGGAVGGGQTAVNNPGGAPNQRPGGTAAQFGRGGFAGGRGGYGGRGVMPKPVGASGGGGGGPVAGPGAATGAISTDRGSANPGSVTSQFQAPKSVTPQSGMIGAAPMAAPPPVAGGGEKDRNRPGYLEDDDNVFGVDRKAAPPVIGL